MADDYLAQMRSVQATGPYHLLGWSFGCHVAHAIACRLQQAGESVGVLALLDGYPEAPGADPAPLADDALYAALYRMLAGAPDEAGDPPRTEAELILRLGTMLPLDSAVLAGVLTAFRDGPRLLRDHVAAVFRGELHFLRAEGDPDKPSPARWQPFIDGHIEVRGVDCQHEAMMRPAGLAQVGPWLAALMPDR